MTGQHGGARAGAGRPPREEPKASAIWVGQIDWMTQQRILDTLSPDERLAALLEAVRRKEGE